MKIVWEGFEVALDGDTVRFGDGEHDWVKPTAYPKSEAFHGLRDAAVDDAGLLHIWGDGVEFIFHHVSDEFVLHGKSYPGNTFHYRWRPADPLTDPAVRRNLTTA